MGHSSAQTTEIYADYAPDPTQGAKFAEAVFGAVGAPNSTEASSSQKCVKTSTGSASALRRSLGAHGTFVLLRAEPEVTRVR
jgi:hypothetical protein